jgi:hypothetical protein
MDSHESNRVWTQPGATLSDKSARNEFGLTQEDIVRAIRADTLQYRVNNMYGNPYYKLLRSEVESLARETFGAGVVAKKKAENELSQINREIKRLKSRIAALERKKADLVSRLD